MKGDQGEEGSAGSSTASKVLGHAKNSIVKIATGAPGKYLTVKSLTPKEVKRNLWPSQSTVKDFQDMIVIRNFKMSDVKFIAQYERMKHGRSSVVSNLLSKVREANSELADFFWVIDCEMDPTTASKDIGKPGNVPGKMIRPVVYCKNTSALIDYLKEQREFHKNTEVVIKVGKLLFLAMKMNFLNIF